MKVKCDHRSKFSNLSNWKEEERNWKEEERRKIEETCSKKMNFILEKKEYLHVVIFILLFLLQFRI